MKQQIIEKRADFSGGLNITAASDAMNNNELLQCLNARVELFGGIMRRLGSKKLNTSPLGGGEPINGVIQWRASSPQIVATSENGNLYHATAPYSSFAEVVPAGNTFTPDHIPSFAEFRASSAGAPLVLYIASNNSLHKWTGSGISVVNSGGAGNPNPNIIRAYGVRLFANAAGDAKTIKWSAIGNAEDWATGGVAGAGAALVDTLSGNEVMALETVGGSLLIGTNESIVRFTGTADDIRIQEQTQGVSADIGPSGSEARDRGWLRVGQVIFMHSERGLYGVTEGGVMSIGEKVFSPHQTALHMTTKVGNVLGHKLTPIVGQNPRRHEVWFGYVPLGGTKRTHVLVYNTRLQCWYGPFVYPFGMTCFGTYEDTDGVETIMAGCDDAYIRVLDAVDATEFDDDVTDYDATIQFAPFGLANGPRTTKALEHVFLQAVGELTFRVRATGDLGQTDDGVLVNG